MEDDDEFGDLYSDVLLPFASSSSAAPHRSSPRPSIDLNLNLHTDRQEELVRMAPYPNSAVPSQSLGQTTSPNHGESVIDDAFKSKQEQSVGEAMVLERAEEELGKLSSVNDDVHGEGAVKEKDSMDMDVKFDIEENGDGVEVVGPEPIIPGLSSDAGVLAPLAGRIDENGDSGQGDEWDSDSDSEDDLQIVLNDNNHMNMERAGMAADGDDDDDDNNVDDDPNQAVEKQEWGENATQPADGERKDMGDSTKASGGVMVAPKIGYNNHAYHPFHSQFKYVRPGAAPIPGATNSTPGVSTGQIRPFNMVPVAGRGRGDWRPPGVKVAASLQKGFHAGLGLPVWGNTAAGRGFGGGLDFTLPSHKTIFDVDIESFEEKPWKYPGVDASDFFNFDLNGETWKDYCRKLEQLRLESTMQSKIRVYECGRTEQEYDPDLPPELAAATGVQDSRVENANSMKSDIGQSDPVKGSGRVRPPLPTGRAIQVESGNGDRLPTIDTRPPRIRDSDAIIEIVLQDSADDDSYAEVGVQDQSEGGEPQREDFQGGILGVNDPRAEHEFLNGFPQYYNGRKRDLAGKKLQFMNAPASMPGGSETLLFPREEPQLSRPFGGKFGSSYGERKMQGRANSLITTPSQETEINDNKREDSFESMEGRDSALLSSPIIKDARESRMEMEDKDSDNVEFGTANESSKMEKVEMDPNTVDKSDTLTDREEKREKSTSRVEEPLLDEVGDVENSKPASSDNSLASWVRSKDYKKQQDEKEGVQDAQSAGLGGHRKHPDDYEDDFHRRGHDGRKEPERNRPIPKSREESHPYKDQHPNSLHQLHMKTGGFDRHKDRKNPNIVQAGRDDPFSIGVRNDEPRKRDKGKARDNKRSDRDDSLHSRKQLDNGGYWAPHDQEIGLRDVGHRDRDDGMKSRYDEAMEDYHSKRRKEEEYLRREHIDKDNISHGYRESSSRRRRERDVVLDPQTRNDQQRSRREREGKISVRSGRGTEEKARPGHSRAQDEHKALDKAYQSRDTMRHSEQLKRRDGVRDVSPHSEGREDSYTRGTQNFSEEKLSRQDRSSSHGDRVVNALDSQRVNERKHREGTKRSKKSDVIGLSKRNWEDHSGEINKKGLKDLSDQGHAEQEISGHRLSRKHQDDISSDDEQQDSCRGRIKLERWTSHKERDFDVNGKPDKDSNDGSSEAGRPVVASAKRSDTIDDQRVLLAEGKDFVDMESKDADTNGFGERHLDTVEKLKKRSERFKLPMPSEKEALTIKKLENEPLPSAKSENHVDSEVKQERPARKRRWISN